MNMFMELCLAALLAVTAENVIFTGGIGFSRVLRAARKPKTIALYSCFVGLFSLASALTACYLGPVLLSNSTLLFMRPAVYAFCAALAYLLVAFVLKTFFTENLRQGWGDPFACCDQLHRAVDAVYAAQFCYAPT